MNGYIRKLKRIGESESGYCGTKFKVMKKFPLNEIIARKKKLWSDRKKVEEKTDLKPIAIDGDHFAHGTWVFER